jgi:hypothetical protein
VLPLERNERSLGEIAPVKSALRQLVNGKMGFALKVAAVNLNPPLSWQEFNLNALVNRKAGNQAVLIIRMRAHGGNAVRAIYGKGFFLSVKLLFKFSRNVHNQTSFA